MTKDVLGGERGESKDGSIVAPRENVWFENGSVRSQIFIAREAQNAELRRSDI
jgi:hypothetical protein